jgi:hypothetical protein
MRPSENAATYIGEQEVKKDGKYGNYGFVNPAFQAELIEEGWHVGWAWCAIFAKVVFNNCFPQNAKVLSSLFSPSAVQTYNNFKKAGYAVSVIPSVDSLVIWQHYKNGVAESTGHAGIVVSVNIKDPQAFESIEGNTSVPGEREGFIVRRNPHRVNMDVQTGLRILGFVTVK